MALRIPLTPDQTLQTEFHEVERRLRALEKRTGVTVGSSIRLVNTTSGGAAAVNLQPFLDRLKALEDKVDNLPEPVTSDFGGVGASSVHGLVPTPGVPEPPTGVAGHVLLSDGTWGFPFRGLVQVVTSGEQTDPPYDVLDVRAGMQTQHIMAADVECFGLQTHGQVVYGDTFWEDLRFPSQGINPAGSPAPAGVDTSTGALSFAGNTDNVIGGLAQMPHAWLPGSIVRPHIHLRFPTSNAGKNTRWQFRYDVASINGDYANAVGTYTSLTAVTVANPASTTKHIIASLGDLPMTGMGESSIIMWQVWRLASSDAADDDTNAAFLLEFDIHYQINKPGSNDEVPTPGRLVLEDGMGIITEDGTGLIILEG